MAILELFVRSIVYKDINGIDPDDGFEVYTIALNGEEPPYEQYSRVGPSRAVRLPDRSFMHVNHGHFMRVRR